MKRWAAVIGLAGLAAVLWVTARHEATSLARPDVRADAEPAVRGAAAFEGGAFGGLSMEALASHALPWKVVAAALVLEAQTKTPALASTAQGVAEVLSGFGFLTDAEVANRPEELRARDQGIALGVTFGDIAPIGGSVLQVSNLGCASCHAGVTYDAQGQPDPSRAWLGMPNTSLNLEAYTSAVFRAMQHGMANRAALFDRVEQLYPDMSWRERQTLRWLVVPMVQYRLRGLDHALPFSNGLPGSTNGVAALKFQFDLPFLDQGVSETGFVSIPDLGHRHLRSSLLVDGAYAPPGMTRQEEHLAEISRPNTVDALSRITAFFTVPSMGVHPERAVNYLEDTQDIFAFLTSEYRPQPFPGPVDMDSALRGFALFRDTCSSCHGTYEWKDETPRLVSFPNWIGDVGTDPLRAQTLNAETAARIGDTAFAPYIDAQHTGQYVAPPLTGIWASAPYLHNGSVPNLRALLAPELRPVRFDVGGHALDFDAVGLRLDADGRYPEGYAPFSQPVRLDTAQPGLRNTGHTLGQTLSDDEKQALIEYLKLL